MQKKLYHGNQDAMGIRQWIAAGLVMIAQVFLPGKIGMIAMGIMVVLLIILPYAYSYILYRKGI